ncbi:CbtA family protein [Pseudomonas gingeri]|uniref:CbtA family protein n=1 Tax=Pseudomonas gingeri TaxID=117681 RepID=A0A7Y7XGN3_9PSED|nr:CbtA family protein [Pseudomonas gingeri]NWA25729.1 CbtA family protein [Pseudomonas gingeri]NWB99186.1 CbtA family protein [Pseudomonas gingeri]NWD67300.1 CbtA family protein [Pseudomonas gingeri]NWD75822.1 CbtA family protein [Pseudomonas gingeri]
MTGQLLVRGMLVGLLAGILAFGFAKVFGEPQIDKAIAFEDQMAQMHGDAPEEELVSREVQSTFGLFTGVVTYSVSLGGIFALVFAYSLGRVGKIGPRGLAALLALAAFVTLILVPGLKYPANPPSIGDPATIAQRTKLFFLMLLVSVIAAVIAINAARKLIPAIGIWGGSILAVALYIVIMAVAGSLFPTINEVPEAFSAVLLWKFRVASLGIQLVLWTTVGLTFGWLAERKLNLPGFSTRA